MPSTPRTSEMINSEDIDASEVRHGMAFLSISSVWHSLKDKGEHVTHMCRCVHCSHLTLLLWRQQPPQRFLIFFLWNICWKTIYCFIKCLHPHFHTMPFSPNALSPSSSCRCSCMHDLQHVQKPQRLAERSRVGHRDLACALFLIRAGLVQNEVRVDGWLDQQKRQISGGISTADPVTGRLWNIKIKTERKSFKGSARASPTVAGHAFTPPATVTRISTFDNRHRRERPASHVEGSFQIFFKNWNWNVQPVLKWKILGEAAVPAGNGGQRLKKLARCSVWAWYSPENGVLRYERPKEERQPGGRSGHKLITWARWMDVEGKKRHSPRQGQEKKNYFYGIFFFSPSNWRAWRTAKCTTLLQIPKCCRKECHAVQLIYSSLFLRLQFMFTITWWEMLVSCPPTLSWIVCFMQ